MRKLIALIIAVIPFNKIRIFLWRSLLNYKIDYQSKIKWGNFICCDSVCINCAQIGFFNRIRTRSLYMGEQSELRNMNDIKYINEFVMKKKSQIISRNSLVGFDFLGNNPINKDSCFELGNASLLTIGHSIDVTNKVIIGNNVVFGGKDTQVWTHGFDINRNMVTKPVCIGNDIYIGSRSLICQGVNIADETVVGAGTCVASNINDSGFYVSNRLIKKGEIKYYDKK